MSRHNPTQRPYSPWLVRLCNMHYVSFLQILSPLSPRLPFYKTRDILISKAFPKQVDKRFKMSRKFRWVDLSLTNICLFIARVCSQKQKMIWRQCFWIAACVMGRPLNIPSASTRAVLSASLATILFCSIDFNLFFVHCTNLSHGPPKWDALGSWKFHSISFGAQKGLYFLFILLLKTFQKLITGPNKVSSIIAAYSLLSTTPRNEG